MLIGMIRAFALACVFAFSLSSVSASVLQSNLNDWAFNIDGEVSEFFAGDLLPGSGDLDSETGMGVLGFEFDSAGTHSLTAFLDFDFASNRNTFFNEYGATNNGEPASGQTWQIDEPGFVFGSIYDNVLAGALNNANTVPESAPEDVSFALAWDFELLSGESALLSLFTSELAPQDSFYLSHTDPQMGSAFDESQSIYFWGDLDITGAPVSVPEPSSLLLLMAGLALLTLVRRRAGELLS
ncbi:MAG: PEP-CTERM sorting domain-containing protein [Oleiphilaceae bacterium]|nr:PEP-CTERM sorting domain-containing protein [Oleiphilaceae bacterium]